MIERKQTHYDVLGVPRNARLTDITRAYNRHKSEVTRDDRPPDLKRETLIREAYETLADEARRDAYDASLVAPDRRYRSRVRAVAIGLVGVSVAAGYLLFMRPEPPKPAVEARATDEILSDASVSVGQVRAIEMSGESAPVAMAVAIGENVMVSSCRGLSPAAQLVVKIPPRDVPVRIASVDDDLGLCRLVSEGKAARPVNARQGDIGTGEVVYAAKSNAAGNLVLERSSVKRVLFEPKTKVIESAPSPVSGAPLFDAQGNVIAVATDNAGKYVPLPPIWIAEAREPFREPKPPAPAPAEPDAQPAPGAQPNANTDALKHLTPEQRVRLQDAHKPNPRLEEELAKMK